LNTNLAAASGATVTMLLTWITQGKPNVSFTLNGVLGGLVAVTAGADVLGAGGSLMVGVIAAFIVVYGTHWIDSTLKNR
jgi:ammonium transporter, Amt family